MGHCISCSAHVRWNTTDLQTHLQLLLVQVHLLQLAPGGLRVPRPVVSLQEVEPQVAESLQLDLIYYLVSLYLMTPSLLND